MAKRSKFVKNSSTFSFGPAENISGMNGGGYEIDEFAMEVEGGSVFDLFLLIVHSDTYKNRILNH